jgi:hypothetical protein
MTNFARYIAAPVICAGAISGAAIGLAGMANASTGSNTPGTSSTVRGPIIVATPNTTAPRWVPPITHRVVIVSPDSGGE